MTRSTSKPLSQRQLRVGAEVRHALAWTLERGELHDPAIPERGVTITEVQMSADLRHARVFVVPQLGGDTEAIVRGLEHAKGFLRRRVGEQVRLRYSPELTFAADTSFATGDRIEQLLREPVVARDLSAGQDTNSTSGKADDQ